MHCTKNALEMLHIMYSNIYNVKNADYKYKYFMP